MILRLKLLAKSFPPNTLWETFEQLKRKREERGKERTEERGGRGEREGGERGREGENSQYVSQDSMVP